MRIIIILKKQSYYIYIKNILIKKKKKNFYLSIMTILYHLKIYI